MGVGAAPPTVVHPTASHPAPPPPGTIQPFPPLPTAYPELENRSPPELRRLVVDPEALMAVVDKVTARLDLQAPLRAWRSLVLAQAQAVQNAREEATSLESQIRVFRANDFEEAWTQAHVAADLQANLWAMLDPMTFVTQLRTETERAEVEAEMCAEAVRASGRAGNLRAGGDGGAALDENMSKYMDARRMYHAHELLLSLAEEAAERRKEGGA